MTGMLPAFDPATLTAFLAAGLLLNLTPGADVMFATASGAAGGWRAGIAAAAGIALGCLVHVALTALGLAAALRAQPLALDGLRWAGAAYLLVLAVQSWRAAPARAANGAGGIRRAVAQGFVTNVLNPKVALFILAFLPQFTDPARGAVWAQILVLGGLFILTGFVVTSAYGALAGRLAAVLHRRGRVLNRLAALVFGGLALRLVWSP